MFTRTRTRSLSLSFSVPSPLSRLGISKPRLKPQRMTHILGMVPVRPFSFGRDAPGVLELTEPRPPHWKELAAEDLFRRSLTLFRYCALADAQQVIQHANGLLLQVHEQEQEESVSVAVSVSVQVADVLTPNASAGLADVLRLKGVLNYSHGRWKEAQEALEASLALFPDELFGSGDDAFVDICGVLNDLALTQLRMNEYEQAEKNLKRGLFMAQRAYEPNKEVLALTKINLAEHAWRQGWYGAAIELLENLLKDKPFKGKREGVCLHRTAQLNLAKAFISAGEADRAESAMSALELMLEDFDPSSTPYLGDVTFAMNLSACKCVLLSLQGDFASAKEEADTALSFGMNIANSCENANQNPDMLQMLQNSAVYSFSKKQAKLKLELASQTEDLLVRSLVAENLNMLDIAAGSQGQHTDLPIARRVHMNDSLSFQQVLPFGGLIGTIFPEREDPAVFYERRSVGHKLEVNAS